MSAYKFNFDRRYFTHTDLLAISGYFQKYCEIAAKNIRLLKAKNQPPSAGYAAFEEFNLEVVRDAHCKDGPEGKKFLFLGIAKNKKSEPVHLEDRLKINSAIENANVAIKSVKAGNEQELSKLGLNLDVIYAFGALLRESYRFAGEIEQAGIWQAGFAAIKSGQGIENVDKRYAALEVAYRKRIGDLKSEIVKVAFNSETAGLMADRDLRFHMVLRWGAVPDHPGSKVVNDVWLPADRAELLFQKMAGHWAGVFAESASDRTYFTPDVFDALAIRMQAHFDWAVTNIRVLKSTKNSQSANYSSFEDIDLKISRNEHMRDGSGGKKHLVAGIYAEGKFYPIYLNRLYRAHSAILDAKGAMNVVKNDHLEFLPTIGPSLNLALFESAVLRDCYRYIADFERAGLPQTRAEAVKAGRELDVDWKEQCTQIGWKHIQNIKALKDELLAVCFDQAEISAMYEKLRFHIDTRWMSLSEEPGAKVINDVWMPPYLAKPLMEKLAGQQAEAMASERAVMRATERKP